MTADLLDREDLALDSELDFELDLRIDLHYESVPMGGTTTDCSTYPANCTTRTTCYTNYTMGGAARCSAC